MGKFTLAARADRTTVAVGEAVTLTLEIKGTGNVRNVRPPALPPLDGLEELRAQGDRHARPRAAPSPARSTVEVLLLPERAGAVMLPSLEVPTFDPEAKRYVTLKSEPLRLDGHGRRRRARRGARRAGAPASGRPPSRT